MQMKRNQKELQKAHHILCEVYQTGNDGKNPIVLFEYAPYSNSHGKRFKPKNYEFYLL